MKQFLYSDMEGSKTLLTRKIKVWVYACFSVNQKNQGVGVCVLQGEKSVCVFMCIEGCHNRLPYAECLTKQKFMLSQIWRVEVHDQGAENFGFWCEVPALS